MGRFKFKFEHLPVTYGVPRSVLGIASDVMMNKSPEPCLGKLQSSREGNYTSRES